MSKKNYDLCMSYLDVIEHELNTIASAAGHCSFAEWQDKSEAKRNDDFDV